MSGEARVDEDDEAFMEAWGSLKTYTLHAYSERYSPSIRHDGPNVRTYEADAVDALLARLRPAFCGPAPDTPEEPEVEGAAERLEERLRARVQLLEAALLPFVLARETYDDSHVKPAIAVQMAGQTHGEDPYDFAVKALRDPAQPGPTPSERPEAATPRPVSSEGDRARGLDTRFIGLSVVAHTGDGPIQGVIVDYDDYAAEIRSGAMHERVTWPCLYWPKDEAREPAKWDDRGSACGGARPVSSEEDRSMVRRWHRIGLYDAPQIRAILTDATTLAQYAKERGK